jgi:DNA-directed RNA polymerase sigma subunit (sigma70/sigma32)
MDKIDQVDTTSVDGFFFSMQRLVTKCIDDSGLTKREKEIIVARFGLDDENGIGRNLSEVAGLMHITRERARQIEAHALMKMRDNSYYIEFFQHFIGNVANMLLIRAVIMGKAKNAE